MSDEQVFARFILEMQTLLTAIDAHAAPLGEVAPGVDRPHALREMARLSRAVAALAQVFEVDDLHSLAVTLAEAATTGSAGDAGDAGNAEPFALLGARDALSYMRWRVERFAADGRAEPPTARDLAWTRRLQQTLSARPDALAPSDVVTPAASGLHAFTGASELTLDELALVQSFSTATLRQRDEQADAQLLARVTGAPSFMAQTRSGAAIPVYGGVSDDDDDDDVIPPEMRLGFVTETRADLRDLGQLMVDFEQRPRDATTLEGLRYTTHKIKGSAATMKFHGYAHIAAAFEAVLDATHSGDIPTDAALFAGFGRFLDLFERALEPTAALEEPDPALIEEATILRDSLRHTHPIHRPPLSASASHALNAERFGERMRAPDHELALHIEARKFDMLMNQLSALAANRGAIARNRSEIAHAQEEMHAALTRLREKSAHIADSHPLTYDNLTTIQSQATPSHRLTSPEQWATADALPAPASASGILRATWSSLRLEQYTEMDTALRALSEVVADVTANYATLASLLSQLGQHTEAQEVLTRNIQDDALGIRLAQLAEITPRLRLSARVAATDLGKLIEFEVQGETIQIDRSLLEELEGPLIQLVRNAIAHGVEQPDERKKLGKSAVGKVWIHAYNVGAEVVIEVNDDGQGINVDLLMGAAIAAQRLSPEEARRLSREQALSFMFQLGITTMGKKSDYAGALAGSGIGLAHVANTIHRLKGSITVRSEPDRGASFQIRVPTSLTMLPVLEVTAAGQTFALPFTLVEQTSVIEPGDLREQPAAQPDSRQREWVVAMKAQVPVAEAAPEQAEDTRDAATEPISDTRAIEIPAYALAETLGFEQDAAALRRMVVIQLRGQTVALLVEAVGKGDVREATVRPLPRRLQRRVVRGAIVRPEDGQVALLIDPHEALAQRLAGAEIILRPATPPTEPRIPAPWVLIVDDSVTIRRTLEQTLTAAGFKTSQARDGYEALEVMEQELPRVIILDVEMPRLSGFDLLALMRRSPQYAQVRVVILTSRAADKHRDYALSNGADAYLVKPCPQETLVETIRRLLTESEPG